MKEAQIVVYLLPFCHHLDHDKKRSTLVKKPLKKFKVFFCKHNPSCFNLLVLLIHFAAKIVCHRYLMYSLRLKVLRVYLKPNCTLLLRH